MSPAERQQMIAEIEAAKSQPPPKTREQMIAEIEAAKSPSQPSVNAIGVTDGPTPAAKVEPDWIDAAKSGYEKFKDFVQSSKAIPAPIRVATNPILQHAVGKAFDYGSGALRTLAADVAGMVKPGKNPISMGDYYDAATGSAPGVGDYAERLGVPTKNIPIYGETHPHLTTKDLTNFVGNTAFNPAMYPGLVKAIGRKMYNNALDPLEVEGQRFNKSDVGDELFKNRISNPLNLRKKVQAAVDRGEAETTATEKLADANGAEVNVKESMKPAQEHVDAFKARAKAVGDEGALKTADEMQSEIDSAMAKQAIKPTDYEVGQSGPNASDAAWAKTRAYKSAGPNGYDVTKRTTDWQAFYKAKGYGLKEATEMAIEKVLGPEMAERYRATNDSVGKMLSTGKAQTRVGDQAARDFTMATSPVPGGTEGIGAAVSAATSHGIEEALTRGGLSVAIQKAMRAARLSQMPVGYALRNANPNMLKSAVVGSQLNPWSTPQGEENGQ